MSTLKLNSKLGLLAALAVVGSAGACKTVSPDDMDASLADQGIDHKSIVRFATPGLNGIKGSGS